MRMLIQPTRRGFLTGLGALLAAPAIVRASSLMPVRSMPAVIATASSWTTPEGWIMTEKILDVDLVRYTLTIRHPADGFRLGEVSISRFAVQGATTRPPAQSAPHR